LTRHSTNNRSDARDSKNSPSRKKSNESISFRLDSSLLDYLRNEAAQRDVSINTVVSHIIKDHATWHGNAARAGFISVRKALITKVFAKYDEDEIRDIAHYVASKSSKDMLLFLRNRYDVAAALDVLETWIKVSGYHYNHGTERIYSAAHTGYSDDLEDSPATIHSYIIQHDMGIKWSIYMSELYNQICSEVGVIVMSRDFTENSVQFVVKIYDNSGRVRGQERSSQGSYSGAVT